MEIRISVTRLGACSDRIVFLVQFLFVLPTRPILILDPKYLPTQAYSRTIQVFKLPPSTRAGFHLTTHSSSLLVGTMF
jgi:hypothetical protein